LQLRQLQTLRQAVDESALDEAQKEKIRAELLESETVLRWMVADARRDPAKADVVLLELRAFQTKRRGTMPDLLPPDQYKAVGGRDMSIGIQLSVLASDPRRFAQTLEGFGLTPEQKAKIDPAVKRMADGVERMKVELDRAKGARARMERLMDWTDELYSLATETRSQIRSALTPEQRDRFDKG